MFFKVVAPFYDHFMKLVDMDYSRRLVEWLQPVRGLEVLDLGGGTGINAGELIRAGARVTIADYSGAMLARARDKKLEARIVEADAADLPLPNQSFDLVLVSDAWHHFRRQGRAAAEMVRVLRPGGRICIVDFDRRAAGTRLLAVAERLLGEPSAFWSPEELVTAFRSRQVQGEFSFIKPGQYIYTGVKE